MCPAEKALAVSSWLERCTTEVTPAALRGGAEWETAVASISTALSGRNTLVGDTLSAADFAVGACLLAALSLPDPATRAYAQVRSP